MYLLMKRAMDILLSMAGLMLLAPVFLCLALAVRLDSPGPVFFRQKRIGIHGKSFYIWKFRTMRTDTPGDMPTHLLEHPERYITRVGSFLRRSSLDELPQIFNILKGDMSIVGPRPALWNQEDLLAEREKYGANDVPAGLTGWAQIHGRDELSIEEKARLDGEYAQKIGFLLDCRCLLGTVGKVLRGDGIAGGGKQRQGAKGSGRDRAAE